MKFSSPQFSRRVFRSLSATASVVLACFVCSGCSISDASPEVPQLVKPTAQLPEIEIDQGLPTDGVDAVAAPAASFLEGSEAELKEPISFSLVNAFYEGDVLVVQAVLESFRELSSSDVLVGILGLREGVVVERQMKPFAEVIPGEKIVEGSRSLVRFELHSPEVSEYQLYSAWGEIAKKEIAALSKNSDVLPQPTALAFAPAPIQVSADTMDSAADLSESKIAEEQEELNDGIIEPEELPSEQDRKRGRLAAVSGRRTGALLLEKVELKRNPKDETCKEEACPFVYSMDAFLRNDSTETISDITLAMGLFWRDDSQLEKDVLPESLSPSLEDNEEGIELGRLSILPGESRRMRVAIDREIPEVPGGSFVPRLRVLSFSKLVPQPVSRTP